MELKLFENALDFIDTAVEYANSGEESRNLKYAVVNLYNGIELLLKKRLIEEDWRLIFESFDKADRSALETGNFKSVGLKSAIDLLDDQCNIKISNDRKVILRELGNIRNRTMHYEFFGTRETIYPLIIKVWAFALEFIGEHLSSDMIDNEEALISKIREIIIKNEEFVCNRRRDVASALKQKTSDGYGSIITCPICFESSLLLSEDAHMCYFCGYGGPYESIMDTWCRVFIGYPYTDPKERSI